MGDQHFYGSLNACERLVADGSLRRDVKARTLAMMQAACKRN